MKIASLFDDTAGYMLQFFEGWETQVPHQGEKGGLRERRVRDFLRRYLPRRYGVGYGHIIDRQGNASLQEDIVIFDQINNPLLEIDPYYQVFPCETVCATVEVKSCLTSQEIDKCIEHSTNLRKMYRGEDLGPIETYVFAYDSYGSARMEPIAWARDKFMEKASSGTERRSMPTIVLCLKKKFMLHPLGGSETRYIADSLDSGILLYFLSKILSRLSQVRTYLPSLFFDYGWEKDNPIIRLSEDFDKQ